jgi:hypothetical protein
MPWAMAMSSRASIVNCHRGANLLLGGLRQVSDPAGVEVQANVARA